MRTSIHELWGSGGGPVGRASPPTRLAAGVVVFAACMVSTGATLGGSLCALAACTTWVLLCQLPWRIVRASGLLGLALFLPYFLLVPWLLDAPLTTPGSLRRALVVPWTILLRGLCGMLVCAATVSTLTATDLREALLRLPVPRIIAAILLQIVHQAAILFYETRRVAAAMAVRGASSGGAAAWRVLFSLPQVWLPRVIVRAERVGAAMELRGFCDEHVAGPRARGVGPGGIAIFGLAAASLGLSIAVRILGAP